MYVYVDDQYADGCFIEDDTNESIYIKSNQMKELISMLKNLYIEEFGNED